MENKSPVAYKKHLNPDRAVLPSPFWNNADLLITHGSRLFGCSTPESDVDIRGFVVEPGEYLLDRQEGKTFEQYEAYLFTESVLLQGYYN